MPNMDGTGPDGKGPKNKNKGMPMRDGRGRGRNCKRNQECCRGKQEDGEGKQ